MVPLRPRDVACGTAYVLAVTASAFRAWRGTVVARLEAANQRGETIAHFTAVSFVRRRVAQRVD